MNETATVRFARIREKAKTGVVHLGLGAFFRAHGAMYIDEAMSQSGGNWGVTGVSLRSAAVRDILAAQDFLYHAVEVSDQGLNPRLMDIVTDVIVAPENPQSVIEIMASENTRIVSMTVTEKGYCLDAAGQSVDFANTDIVHDLNNSEPRSAPGYILRALEVRWREGRRPFTVLSLDNLAANGRLIKQVIYAMALQIDKGFADWVESECCFPCSMVDRIVPKTTQEFLTVLKGRCAIDDAAAVNHEPFKQWVLEDNFVDGLRPDFKASGVQLVGDVALFESMKLRMLNGTHSAMAYLGALAGHTSVLDAINDPIIEEFLEVLWKTEISASLQAPPDTDLGIYAKQLKVRYQNPEIHHLLAQIAMDGSQKLPQRILDPLFENIEAGRAFQNLMLVVAAWFRYVQKTVRDEAASDINDPLANELQLAVKTANDDDQLVKNLLNLRAVFEKYPTHLISDRLTTAMQFLGSDGLVTSSSTSHS